MKLILSALFFLALALPSYAQSGPLDCPGPYNSNGLQLYVCADTQEQACIVASQCQNVWIIAANDYGLYFFTEDNLECVVWEIQLSDDSFNAVFYCATINGLRAKPPGMDRLAQPRVVHGNSR